MPFKMAQHHPGVAQMRRHMLPTNLKPWLAFKSRICVWVMAAGMLLLGTGATLAGDAVTVAALRFVSSGPIFIAKEKGYFAAEGLDVTLKFFDAAQPVAVAIASGDTDFGATGFTAGLFNIAGKGALKIIGAQFSEVRGYQGSAFLVSNKAFAAGLTELDKLEGRTFGLTQTGSSFHYMIGRMAGAAGIDISTVSLKPLQTVGNVIGALKTGQIDSAILPSFIARPLIAAGDAKLIAWVGDVAPYQGGGLFAAPKTIEKRRAVVERFVRAYQRGIADYRAAFIDKSGADAEIIPLIHKYVYADQDAAIASPKIRDGALYIAADGRLDGQDVALQIEWYQEQGLVDKTVEAPLILDFSFIPALQP